MEVDHYEEYEHGGEEVGEVGEVVPDDGLLEGVDLIGSDEQSVEESDDGTFVLKTEFGFVSDGGERLPHDVLADVDGDEEGCSRLADTVSLGEQFVDEDHDNSGKYQLHNDQNSVTSTQLIKIAIHTRPYVSKCFT